MRCAPENTGVEIGSAEIGVVAAPRFPMGKPRLRQLGRVDCDATIAQMRAFTDHRGPTTGDEVWLCEHPPVYTQGLAGRAAHLHHARGIPVLHTDRGGQITYHGPGQVVAYPLIDLRRLGLNVKEYVYRLEQALLGTLEQLGVTGHRVAGAPGVYVRRADPFGHSVLGRVGPAERAGGRPAAPSFTGLAKIAALGIKVGRNGSYHGVALNVAMDLGPYAEIDACGYPGLETVDLSTIGVQVPFEAVAATLGAKLVAALSH